jgi:benzoyl-CoA reductase/2-hydroxyglutaryl-CoA dehydratase subunit BcrC/BadD/HgdB
MTFATHVDGIVADPLRAAREAAARGERAIGYVGGDVPVELILAARAIPVRLRGWSDVATPAADRYLEDSFSPQSRSIAQRWLSGELDALDCVILSRSDDSAQRLYYYICELQRRGWCAGPKPLLYDVAGLSRPLSLAHTIDSTRRLAIELGVQSDTLGSAVQRVDRRAALLAELTTRRFEADPPPGALSHRIARASHHEWSERFDAALRLWITRAPRSRAARRLLLIGSAPPDERIHDAVERNGAVVVGEINEAEPAVPASSPASDPIEAVAHRARDAVGAARALLRSPDALVRRIGEVDAQGAILWLIAEDTGLAWEAPRIARALRAAGAPLIVLTQQAWNIGGAALARIARFAHTLETDA